MSLAFFVQRFIGRHVDESASFTATQVLWRTVAIGLLASVGTAVLPLPASIVGAVTKNTVWQGVAYAAELAIITAIAVPVLITQWRLPETSHPPLRGGLSRRHGIPLGDRAPRILVGRRWDYPKGRSHRQPLVRNRLLRRRRAIDRRRQRRFAPRTAPIRGVGRCQHRSGLNEWTLARRPTNCNLAEPDPTQPITNWQAALGDRNRRDRPPSCPSGGEVDVNPAAQALAGPYSDAPATAAAATATPVGQCISLCNREPRVQRTATAQSVAVGASAMVQSRLAAPGPAGRWAAGRGC